MTTKEEQEKRIKSLEKKVKKLAHTVKYLMDIHAREVVNEIEQAKEAAKVWNGVCLNHRSK